MKNFKLSFLPVFCMLLSLHLKSQISGTYSVPGSFTSIAGAITNINTFGISGPVTINIAAGYTETAVSGGYSLFTVIGSSSVNTVTFRKNGAGANPVIYAYAGVNTPTSLTQDGVWRFIGADHVTVDGINITDLNTSNPATMEFGFCFFKASTTNGCQYNTIKNCVISLNRVNAAGGGSFAEPGSKGIQVVNTYPASHHFYIAAPQADAGNSFNKFHANVIQNCHIGICMSSVMNSTTEAVMDHGNDVGGLSAVTGNTIINFGGGGSLTASSGIYTHNQADINISYNVISNNNGSGAVHSGTLFGIRNDDCPYGDVTIRGNTITVRTGTACPAMYGIANSGGSGTDASDVVLSDNLVTGCTSTLSTGVDFFGIDNQAAAGSVLFSNNTFTNNFSQSQSGTVYLLRNNGAVTNSLTFANNVLTFSFTAFGGFNGNFYVVANTCSVSTMYSTAVTFSNNVFSNFFMGGSGDVAYIHNSGSNRDLIMSANTWSPMTNWLGGSTSMLSNNSTCFNSMLVENNAVTGYTNGTSGGGFSGFGSTGSSPSSCSIVIRNNVFSNISYTVYSAGGFMGLFSGDGAGPIYPHKEIYNNLISNITYSTGNGSATGMYLSNMGEGSGTTPSAVYNNTVSNLISSYTAYGIRTFSLASPNYATNIYANLVNSVVCTSSAAISTGVHIEAGETGLNFYRNKIINIVNTNNLGCKGIECERGSNINIYNNIIGAMTATNSGSQDAGTGIYMSGGKLYRLYYNTIFINGSLHGSSCVHAYSTATLDVRNNIFMNTASAVLNGTTAAFRLGGPVNNDTYSITCNNNLFYAGTPGPYKTLFQLGVPSYSTLAEVKAYCLGRELSSVTESVSFASTVPTATNYLNISTTVSTQIEGGAGPIPGITDDFYGNPRDPSFPDIGAVEGNYIPGNADRLAPTFTSVGFTQVSCNTSGRTLTVTLADKSGIATGSLSPRIYYSINSSSFSSVQGSLSAGSSTLGVWTFPLTYTVSPGDEVSYFVLAQDVAPTPNIVSWPPSTFSAVSVHSVTSFDAPFTYTVYEALAGSYTVGTSGTFSTLTQAAKVYNRACLTGPVSFVLTNSLYNAAGGEIFPVTFSNNIYASATNSLLVTSAGNVTIQGAATASVTAIIKFADAANIMMDGHAGGGQIQLTNANTASNSACIWLAGTAGNNFIALKNMVISSFTNSQTYGVAATANNSVFSVNDGIDNDNISIQSNTIFAQQYGIYASGSSSLSYGGFNNWLISGNQIGSAASSTGNIGHIGIYLRRVMDFSVHSNTVMNISGALTNTSTCGISIYQGCGDGTVSANYVRGIRYTGTGNGGAIGISLNPFNAGSRLVVHNNMVSDIQGTSTFAGNTAGINLGGYLFAGTVDLVHNSIALTGSTTASHTAAVISSAIHIGSNAAARITLLNNIFYTNVANTGNASSDSYALYSVAGSSVFSRMDFNNYYAEGSQGVAVYYNGSRTTLAAIQSTMGQNAQSRVTPAVFTSSTDLHLDPSAISNYFLDGTAQYTSTVPSDIDGQTRTTSGADIGADEFTATGSCTTASGGTISTAAYTICGSSSLTLTSVNPSGGIGTSHQWQEAASASGPFTNVSSGTGYTTGIFSPGTLPGGVRYYRLYATCAAGSFTGASNIVTVNVVAPPSPTITISNSVICAGSSATLTGSGANTFSWSTGVIASSIVVTPTASGFYSVYYGSSPCTFSNSPGIAFLYSPNPTVTASSSSTLVCAGYPLTLTASGANSYSWSHGAVTASAVINPTISGTYTVTGALSNGCRSSAVRQVSVNTSPSVAISGPSVICSGETATLIASGAGSYSWNSGSTSPTLVITPSASTNYVLTGTNGIGCTSTTSQSVTVIVPQNLTITAPASACNGSLVNISVSGGAGYLWNTGATTSSIAPTLTATTTFSVLSGTGNCTTSAAVTVSVDPTPAVSITGATAVCSGQAATLTAHGANSYLWSTGATTSSVVITPVSATNYSVIGTNAAGCDDVEMHAVTTLSVPAISILQSAFTVCPNSAVSFTALGAQTYSWSGSATGSVLPYTAVSSTVIAVTGSDGFCSSTQNATLHVLASPVVTVSPPNQSICAGSSVTFSVTGASSYSWSNGFSTPVITFTPVASGALNVTGTASTGCSDTRQVTITVLPNPTLAIAGAVNNTIMVCAGTTISLAAGLADTYTWSTGFSGSTISLAAPLASTGYSVSGSYSTGCTGAVAFTVIPAVPPTLTIVPGSTLICAGKPVTLTPSGSVNYYWPQLNSTSSVQVVSPVAPVVYTVNGDQFANCISTGTILLAPDPLPTLSVSSTAYSFCPGSAVTLSASGASTYSWSNAMSGPAITVTPVSPVIYTVTGVSAAGCLNTATIALSTFTVPVVSVAGSTGVCLGQASSYTASGAGSYAWSTGSTGSVIALSPSANTVITVTGTNASGCAGGSTLAITSLSVPVISVAQSAGSVCAGSAVSFSASGASSYSWNTGHNGAVLTISPASSSLISVSGTNAAGCVSSGSAAIQTNSLPVISIAPASLTVCAFSTVTFTAAGASSFTWDNGAQAASTSYTPAANSAYSVTGTSAAGCVSSKTVGVVTNSLPVLAVTGNTGVCLGQTGTLSATGAQTYSWSTGASAASTTVAPQTSTLFVVSGTNAAGCRSSLSVVVLAYAVPVITVQPSASTICAGNPVTFTATGASSYSWSSGGAAGTITVFPVTSSAYTVTGQSLQGCAGSATIAVTTLSLPAVSIAPAAATVCAQTPVSFTASGASSYIWSTTSTNASTTVTPLNNGVLTVTGTAPNGCTASQTAAITTNTLPVVSISGNTNTCAGTQQTLIASGASSYLWNTGSVAAQLIVSPLTNTAYVVTGTSAAGCTGTAGISVTTNSLPVLSATASPSAVCAGSDVTLTIAGASQYTWFNSAVQHSIVVTPLISTNFSVTGANAAGCQSTISIAVLTHSIPVLQLSALSQSMCAGGAASFAVAGASSYSWSNGLTTGTVTVTPAITSTYIVTGTNNAGCSASEQVTVTVYGLPTLAVSGNTSLCNGQTSTLTASGAATYSWSTGAMTATVAVSPFTNTTYIVVGVTTEGCNGSFTIPVTSVPVPTLSVIPSSTAACAGSDVTLTASGASMYAWSDGSTLAINVTSVGLQGSTFTLTGYNSGICTSTAAISIAALPLPSVTVSPQMLTICAGDQVDLIAGGASTFVWYPGTLSGSLISVAPVITTTYIASGTDSNGCSGLSTAIISVDPCTGIFSGAVQDLLVYPSPFSTVISISGGAAGAQVSVYDNAGRLILTIEHTGGFTSIDMQTFAKGIYLVRVVNQGKTVLTKRLIKS